VVEQNGETAFRTQGDANENPDRSLVTPADLEGKVLSVGGFLVVIPLIGHVIQFASTPLGLVALLILPLGALVVSEIWDVVAAAKGDANGSAAAAGDGDGGDDQDGGDDEDGGGGDGATAATEGATNGERIEDRETDLEPDAGGESATIEELARTVEERPESAGTSATGDGSASETVADARNEPAGTGEGAAGADETEGSDEGAGEDGEASDEEDGLVFSAAELQLGLLVLVGFFAYSLWVAYATFFEVWAFAVAASVAAALLLLGGLYLTGGEADAAETAEQEADEGQTADEQQETAADDGSALGTDDDESLFAPDDDPIAEREPEPTTAETAAAGEAQVDVEDLLSLGEAGGVDPQRDAPDLNGAEGALDEDGRTDAEAPEVSDDD